MGRHGKEGEVAITPSTVQAPTATAINSSRTSEWETKAKGRTRALSCSTPDIAVSSRPASRPIYFPFLSTLPVLAARRAPRTNYAVHRATLSIISSSASSMAVEATYSPSSSLQWFPPCFSTVVSERSPRSSALEARSHWPFPPPPPPCI